MYLQINCLEMCLLSDSSREDANKPHASTCPCPDAAAPEFRGARMPEGQAGEFYPDGAAACGAQGK